MDGERVAPFDHTVSACLAICVSVTEGTLSSLTPREESVPRLADPRALLSRSWPGRETHLHRCLSAHPVCTYLSRWEHFEYHIKLTALGNIHGEKMLKNVISPKGDLRYRHKIIIWGKNLRAATDSVQTSLEVSKWICHNNSADYVLSLPFT